VKAYSSKWPKLSSSERRKYESQAENDKERYHEHLELVKKNILQKPLKENATSYRLYQDEMVRVARENGEDTKEAKKNASESWKSLDTDAKAEWEEKKKDHMAFYDNLRHSKQPANAYNLYTRDQFAAAKEKGTTTNLKEISEKWKKAKDTVKEKYAEYAYEDKEERAKQRDLYEIAFNIKPRRPLGPFKFFLMEMAKLGKLAGNPLVEGHKLWKKISDEDREKYEKIAQRDKLAYIVKKIEYDLEVKKSSTYKAMSPFNIFCQEFKGKLKDGKYEGKDVGGVNFFHFAFKQWQKLDATTKRKYVKKSDEDKVEAAKMKEEFKARVYEAPKKPGNYYTFYIKSTQPELKAKYPKKDAQEIFKMAAENWKDMSDKQKGKYVTMYNSAKETYEHNLKAFETDGYYTPNEKSIKKERESSPGKRKSEKKKSGVKSRSTSNSKKGKKSIKD
jgi:hypothetical protein